MDRLRDLEAARLEMRLGSELLRVTNQAAGAYPRWKQPMVEHVERLSIILSASLSRVAIASANLARETTALPLAEAAGMTRYLPTQSELDAGIQKVAKQRAAQRAVDVSNTTRERINNAVVRGLEANEAPAEIARRIRDEVSEMNVARARTIARTETAVAQQTGQYQEMEATSEALGMPLLKTWVATEDERTRDSHSAADGQTVALEDPFEVGESELMHPSDPEGPAEEVINCRCGITYAPK